jgi:hypothetical protein
MATAQRYHGSSFALVFVLGMAVLATGCCGPMACGPMGCGGCGSGGPIVLGGGCGGGACNGCDGCGETYIDEWINHPPTCDQCDCCGNHGGQTCGNCRPIFDGFKSLWGYRRDCGCDTSCGSDVGCSGASCDGGCSGGCSSCGGGGAEEYVGGEMGEMEEHYVDSSPAIPMPHQPTPAPRLVEAKPAVKPYQPQRTKQIFRPKSSSSGGSIAGKTPHPSQY